MVKTLGSVGRISIRNVSIHLSKCKPELPDSGSVRLGKRKLLKWV